MDMRRRTQAGLKLLMILIASCTFLITPVFAQAHTAQADQSEIDSLLNSSHVTSWAYYRDPSRNAQSKWYISDSSGTTYALGRNSRGHSSWIALANQESVATLDFINKKVSLRSDTATRTPNDSYLAISLVSGEGQETVRGSVARDFANLTNGNTLNLDWYFFQVASTRKWYIVWIDGTNSIIYRLNLNASLDNYDWKMPLHGSGVAIDTSNWSKEFFQENGAWKVRFNSFQWPIPIPAGATIDSQATTTMDFYDSSGRRYLYKAGFEFKEPTGTTYTACGTPGIHDELDVKFHPGIDINVVGTSGDEDMNIPTPVYAIAGGTVANVDVDQGSIVIKHPVGNDGTTSVWANYRHTRAITVARGHSVRKGQQIAEMGHEGAGAGNAHLHFEVRKSGHPDPASAQFWCGYGGLSATDLDNWLYNPLQFIRDHR